MQLGALEAAIGGPAPATHGLHPGEDRFDPLANPLAQRVAGMSRGAAIERGAASATLIARDVRSDLERAAGGDDLRRVVALVGTQCNPAAARQLGFQHRPGAFALGVAVSRFDREKTFHLSVTCKSSRAHGALFKATCLSFFAKPANFSAIRGLRTP